MKNNINPVLVFILASCALISISLAARVSAQELDDEPPDINRVQKLVEQMGSASYAERKNAERLLIEIGPPLLDLLEQFDSLESVEIKMRLLRVERSLKNRGLTLDQWILTCEPLPGETLNLTKTRHIRFFEDGTFVHDGRPGRGQRLWNIDEDSSNLVMTYNKAYATYRGQFIDNSNIEGTAENIKGKRWRFKLTRAPDPAD